MAKKEKVQLTPEEIIQKKIRRSDRWTRFWAVVVALALTAGVFAFARTQGIKASEATEVETSENAENSNSNSSSNNSSSNNSSSSSNTSSNTPSNSSSTDSSSSSSSSSSSASTDNNSAAPADSSNNGGGDVASANDPASVAALINKVTGEAVAAKAGYDWARDCDVQNIDVGGAFFTNILNGIINGVSKGDDLNSVVGGFLGKGSKSYNVPQGQTLDSIVIGTKDDGSPDYVYHGSSYALKATNLQAGDIQSLAVSGDTYEFDLADSDNPDRSGNTAFSRFCGDIVVRDEVASEIKDQLKSDAVTVTSLDGKYHDIHVKAVISDGKLKELTYSMKADATLVVKAGPSITGTGNLDATARYTNINY